jgi:ubiquinone biosynthesis protein
MLAHPSIATLALMPSVSQRNKALAPFKDFRRATEIFQILVQHGFGYLLNSKALAQVPDVKPGDVNEKVKGLPRPERVRLLLEALGPTFVKLGQILSTRADIVPDDVARSLKALQDQAEPFPYETVKKVIEEDLGRPIDELFTSFEKEPLATASIAQVHRASLAQDGMPATQVVVKVQRPGIREKMRSDLSLLYWLARFFEGTIEEVSAYSPTTVVEEFEGAVEEELDFIHERRNLELAGKNFAQRKELVVIPQAFPERSSGRVLTMEYLDGIKITDTKDDPRYDHEKLWNNLVEASYYEVFEDGFFHGDPHPGNVLVLKDGRLGLIDYGLWGHLTKEQQESLVQWLTAIGLKSPAALARLTLRIGQPPANFDRQAYERDIARLMDKYVGKEIRELDSASIIADSVEVIRRHRIKLPADFAVLARASATLEGVVRHINPGMDFQKLVLPYVQRLMMKRLDIKGTGPEAMGLLLGMQEFVREVPSQINQLLLDLSTGRFRASVQGEPLEDLAATGSTHGVRIILAILCGSFIIAAAIAFQPYHYTWHDVPLVPVVLIVGFFFNLAALTTTFVFPKGLRKIRLSKLFFWRR